MIAAAVLSSCSEKMSPSSATNVNSGSNSTANYIPSNTSLSTNNASQQQATIKVKENKVENVVPANMQKE